MKNNRENFGSSLAMILAMAGSAIGLGNLWRFPFLVGQNGGAAFIIVYILACALLALPIFFAEYIIGRRSRSNCFGAMDKLAPGSKWKWVGLLTVITPIVVLGYYSVVGGWSIDYTWKACTGALTHDTNGLFGGFISQVWEPVITHTLFVLASALIILLGVKKGIEKFSKVAMPILFVLIIVIAVFGLTLPGAMKGVEYLVKPDFSRLNTGSIAAAMGQAFFSMSLGVGAILIYASYSPEQENIVGSGLGTAGSDLLFAILAGFAIMPAVFSAGIQPGEGPGLVFDTLPFIFSKMNPVTGTVIAIMFFVTVLAAALTSSISLLEVGVSYLMEEKGMSRVKGTVILSLIIWVVGILCSLSFGPLAGVKILGLTMFDLLDKLCSNFLMPLGGLLFVLFVGWKMSKADVRDEFTSGGTRNVRLFSLVYFLMRYVAPAGIVLVFITALL
ncbi:MAG: sodium-dependent transporter [Bacteroidales bacterium]|nr:sodium-dependent transporter [Bacteroidales bacterium]